MAGWETKLSNLDTVACFSFANSVSSSLVLFSFFNLTQLFEISAVMVGSYLLFFLANGSFC